MPGIPLVPSKKKEEPALIGPMDPYMQNSHQFDHTGQFTHGSLPPLMPMMDNGYKRKLDDSIDDGPPKKRQGRRKIKIEFIGVCFCVPASS